MTSCKESMLYEIKFYHVTSLNLESELKNISNLNALLSSRSSSPTIAIAPLAAMRSVLTTSAPSATLLKFLKSQSENICFFSSNPRPGFTFDHAAPRCPALRLQTLNAPLKLSARSLSTSSARRATVEAGFVNLDFLWAKAASKVVQPKTPQYRSTPRFKKSLHEGFSLEPRAASTGWHQWHEKVWARKKKGQVLQPDDLPDSPYRDDGGDSIFSLGSHISAKAAAQLSKVRCTELDENGNVVLASGEFKKTELIAKVLLSLTTSNATSNLYHSTACYLAIFERLIPVYSRIFWCAPPRS